MAAPLSYSDIIHQMSEITERIHRLLGELRPITDQISAGAFDSAIFEKNNRLQSEIARLDELRDRLQKHRRGIGGAGRSG